MKHIRTLLATGAVVLSTATASAEYNGEVTLGLGHSSEGPIETNLIALELSTFLDVPLSHDGKQPHNEAAFMQRAAELQFIFARTETDIDLNFGSFQEHSDFNVDAYGAGYIFRSRNSAHGFAVEATRFEANADGNNGSANAFSASYFNYVNDSLLVGSELTYFDDSNNDWMVSLFSEKLFTLSSQTWLKLEGEIAYLGEVSNADEIGLSIDATYYFSAATGLGVSASTTEEFDYIDTAVTLSHYLRDNLALGAGIEFDDSDDSENYLLSLTLRF